MYQNKNAAVAIGENVSLLKRRKKIVDAQAKIALHQMFRAAFDGKRAEDIPEVYEDFCRRTAGTGVEEKTEFCRYACELRPLAEHLEDTFLRGNAEAVPAGTHGKIAYIRTDRADAAYSRLSKSVRGSKVHYVSTFGEACAAVSESICELCILPIESTSDGRLYSFYAMLDRYELKICAVTDVPDDDGTGSTVFALVGRSIEPQRGKSAYKRLEFSVICESAAAISDIAIACRALGGELYAVGTQALPYDDEGNKYYFAVDFSSSAYLALALFASLEYPRFSLVGLYTKK